ncbi:MAG: hypothetical protein JJP05_06785 [cyanobacterium endosymbiont of Rhopalodia gibba]
MKNLVDTMESEFTPINSFKNNLKGIFKVSFHLGATFLNPKDRR